MPTSDGICRNCNSHPGDWTTCEVCIDWDAPALVGPRPFVLVRDVDVTGISGVGVVAEGVLFAGDVVALRWMSDWPTSVVFHDRGMASIVAVHGHAGATRVVFTASHQKDVPD